MCVCNLNFNGIETSIHNRLCGQFVRLLQNDYQVSQYNIDLIRRRRKKK